MHVFGVDQGTGMVRNDGEGGYDVMSVHSEMDETAHRTTAKSKGSALRYIFLRL